MAFFMRYIGSLTDQRIISKTMLSQQPLRSNNINFKATANWGFQVVIDAELFSGSSCAFELALVARPSIAQAALSGSSLSRGNGKSRQRMIYASLHGG